MEKKPRRVAYACAVLEGTPFEIGKAQGRAIAAHPAWQPFMTMPFSERGPLAPREIEEAIACIDRWCPDLNEELRGAAEALGIPQEQLTYYAITHCPSGRCSHFALLPPLSADGRVRVGRSYEFSPRMSDLRLGVTRAKGKYAHLGFSEIIFGRDDGLNEQGLCVTMSAGAPGVPTREGGLRFWAVVRAALETCADVEEAVDLFLRAPISFHANFLLADRLGHAALVEVACSRKAVKRIGPASPEKGLLATNHYTLPGMLPYDLGRQRHSVVRHARIRDFFAAAQGSLGPEEIRGLLATPYPRGLCCYHYDDFFGTLWSVIFDVSSGTAEVSFGPPDSNPWRTFGLQEPAGTTEYPAILPEAPASPEIWEKLVPGAE